MRYLVICLLFGVFQLLNAGNHEPYQTDPYATHQPVLYEMAMKTSGPIIEFGCGKYSTDLLHKICKKNKRMLITIEDNLEWLTFCAKKHIGDGYNPEDNSGWHKFFYVPGKVNDTDPTHWVEFLDSLDLIKENRFSICFIDQSPWLARFETLKRMKSCCDYVIIHDVNHFPEYGVFGSVIMPIDRKNHIEGIYDFSDVFQYSKLYYPMQPWPGDTGPPTLLGSDQYEDLPEIDYKKYLKKKF